jgi:hypothetical protein
LRHRFDYRMAAGVPLHRLAKIMGHDSLDTTLRYMQGTAEDLQNDIETIAWTSGRLASRPDSYRPRYVVLELNPRRRAGRRAQ